MNTPQIDPVFRAGLRRELIERAAEPQSRRPARLLAIGGLSLSLLAIGGAAVAGGVLGLPGGESRIDIGAPIVDEGVGDGSLELGAPPEGATKLRIELRCLTAGVFAFPAGGGYLTCSAEDAREPEGSAGFIFATLEEAGSALRVEAGDGERWQLTVTYLDAQPIPLATNLNGDTYGIDEAPEGRPDLIAVVASNGREGYAYADELDEADGTAAVETFRTPEDALAWQAAREGKSFVVPVYLSDGETLIGELVLH